MLLARSISRLLSASLAVSALAAPASSLIAQGRPLFDWRGRVDREVRIVMRGRSARTQTVGRAEVDRSRLHVATALPLRDGRVTVRVQDGRGDVDVVQQPSRRNDYTTIVRIRDRSSGTDTYRVRAYWMPERSGWEDGTWDGRDGYPNRPGRGDDDRGGWGRGNDDYGRGDDDYGRGAGYGRSVLRWSGEVDDRLEIRIQGNRIDYRTLSGKSVRDVRANLTRGGLPRRDVQVFVSDYSGRGSVSVVQQPSSWNGYTAVIRIYDPRPSYGAYRFDVGYRDGYSARW